MRIERSGPVGTLTDPVFRFLEEAMGGISLDQDGDKERRPDWSCLRGLLVVEVKTLEGPPKERLDNAIRPETEREDWPRFFGKWPIESVLKHLADREKVERRLSDRLGRAIVTHVKKANDQLQSHREREAQRNAVRLAILVNEDHAEYTPDVVRFVAGRELWRLNEEGLTRNAAIDAIIYLSHRHAADVDGQVTFPITVIEGRNLGNTPWKRGVLDLTIRRWCRWNNAPLKDDVTLGFDSFQAVEHVPSRMRRQELWELEYRRRPYMRNWKDENVREFWDVTIILFILAFVKGSPMTFPASGTVELSKRMSHLMQETARRGLARDYFKPEPERLRRTIDGLPYGETVRSWLLGELHHLVA